MAWNKVIKDATDRAQAMLGLADKWRDFRRPLGLKVAPGVGGMAQKAFSAASRRDTMRKLVRQRGAGIIAETDRAWNAIQGSNDEMRVINSFYMHILKGARVATVNAYLNLGDQIAWNGAMFGIALAGSILGPNDLGRALSALSRASCPAGSADRLAPAWVVNIAIGKAEQALKEVRVLAGMLYPLMSGGRRLSTTVDPAEAIKLALTELGC